MNTEPCCGDKKTEEAACTQDSSCTSTEESCTKDESCPNGAEGSAEETEAKPDE